MTTLPSTFELLLKERLKERFASYNACLKEKPFKGFRINTLKTDIDSCSTYLPWNPSKHPFCENGFYYDDSYKISHFYAYHAGLLYSQEPSASLPVTKLDIEPGMHVLDLCAAPGSKSTQILELLKGEGYLVANDVSTKRIRSLVDNIEKHGSSNAIVMNQTMKDMAILFPSEFDAVLCDAPCSGEGMFRKEEMAIEQWSLDLVNQCVSMQKQALETAYACLKEGGTLVYSTCTFNHFENEDQIQSFISRHPDMEFMEANLVFPMDGGEGQFYAKLKKKGERIPNKSIAIERTKLPEVAQTFLNGFLVSSFPFYRMKGDKVYGASMPIAESVFQRTVQYGTYLGEVKKNRFEPSHALTMVNAIPLKHTYALTNEEVTQYLKGMSLPIPIEKGYVVLTWEGHPLGLGKSDGKLIKNHYPKFLRVKDNEILL